MSRYGKIFYKLMSETNTAGAGGSFGNASSMNHGGEVPGGGDWYAPGDARVPKVLGIYSRAGKIKKKKKGRK